METMQWTNTHHNLASQAAPHREMPLPTDSPKPVMPVEEAEPVRVVAQGEEDKPVDQPVRTQPPVPVPEKVDEAIQDLVEEVMDKLLHGQLPAGINHLNEERTAKQLLNVYA